MCEIIFFPVCSYQSENGLRNEDLVFAVLLIRLAANIFLVYVCVSTLNIGIVGKGETHNTLCLGGYFYFFFCHNLFWCHGSGRTILSVCSDQLCQYLYITDIDTYWLYFIHSQPCLDLSGSSLLISVNNLRNLCCIQINWSQRSPLITIFRDIMSIVLVSSELSGSWSWSSL